MRQITSILSAALIAAVAATAHAQEWSVVEMGNCSELGAGEPARSLRAALSQQLAGKVAPEETTAKALGGSASASKDLAERFLAAARLDFTSGDLDRAIHELEQGRETYVALAPSVERWNGVRDTQTMRAWIDLKQGRREEAETDLREILSVDPDFSPSEVLFPPMIRNLNQAVWRSMKHEVRSPLTIRTEPPGLPVFVGERPVGKSPATVSVPPGHYRVEAGFAHARGLPHELDVNGPTEVSLSESVEGAVWPEHGPCLSVPSARTERLRLLDHIAGVVHAEKLVGIEFEEPSPGERYLGATVLDASTGQELRAARVKLAPDMTQAHAVDELAAFVATGRAPGNVQVVANGAPKVAPAASSAAEVSQSSKSSGISGMRLASYITAGVGVAALGFGVAELVRKGSANSDFQAAYPDAHNGDPAAIQRASDAQNRASSAGTLATVGLVAGGAAVVTGVVLFIVSGSEPAVQPTVASDGRQTTVALVGRF